MSVTEMTRPAEAATEEEPKKGSKKKLLIIVLLVALLGGGGGYWFFLKPKDKGPEKPDPGVVVKLDAIQVNLAAGHYLRIGIALQASKDAGEEVDGSKALDATIDTFSGRTTAELAEKEVREKLKKHLEHTLDELYEGEVIGVYFTDFVTQ
jgi:flagellar FliL protein